MDVRLRQVLRGSVPLRTARLIESERTLLA